MFSVVVSLRLPEQDTAIPPVAKYGTYTVASTFDKLRYVVGLVLITKIVGRPAWRKVLISDPLAVQVQLVQSHRRGIEARPFNFPLN